MDSSLGRRGGGGWEDGVRGMYVEYWRRRGGGVVEEADLSYISVVSAGLGDGGAQLRVTQRADHGEEATGHPHLGGGG